MKVTIRVEGKVINDLYFHKQSIGEIEIHPFKKSVRGMEKGPVAYDSDFKQYHRFMIDEGLERNPEKNENIVLFISKSTDITDLVIKAFDLEKK